MTTPEGKVKTEVVKWLRDLPFTHFFQVQDRYTAGIPDIIGVHQGRFFAMEVKAPVGRVSPLQKVVILRIKRCLGVAGVVRSVDDAKAIIKGCYNV